MPLRRFVLDTNPAKPGKRLFKNPIHTIFLTMNTNRNAVRLQITFVKQERAETDLNSKLCRR